MAGHSYRRSRGRSLGSGPSPLAPAWPGLAAAALAVPLTVFAITAAPASAAVRYRVAHTVRVGPDPVGVAVDPTLRPAYVTNNRAGTVSVIDEATSTVTHPSGWVPPRSRWRWTPRSTPPT